MPDDPTPTPTPAPEPAAPAPAPAPAPEPAAPAPASTSSEPFDPERARRTIEAQRASEKAAKDAEKAATKRADELAARVKELEDAVLTADQKKEREQQQRDERLAALERENAAITQERQQFNLWKAVVRLAPKLQLVDVDACIRLLDLAAVTFDDGSQPDEKSLTKALTDLLDEKPFLKAPVASAAPAPVESGATTNPARSQARPGAKSHDEVIADIYGRSINIFDPEAARASGQGVVWNTPKPAAGG